MPKKKGTTAVSVEYFLFREDTIWKLKDAEIAALAIEELGRMGLVRVDSVENFWVKREVDCYPTYFIGHEEYLDQVKEERKNISNVTTAGRGGLYKYNNMDHSLYSGILAARNMYLRNEERYDLWQINIDVEYHESDFRKS